MAIDVARRSFEITKRFPGKEKYSLSDQVRRSSRSVPANIGEAWRKRCYPTPFISKLNDAEGEAAEAQTHLEIALRCKYLTPPEAQAFDSQYEQILAKLVSMACRPEDWTIVQRHGEVAQSGRGDRETRGSSVRAPRLLRVSPLLSTSRRLSVSRMTPLSILASGMVASVGLEVPSSCAANRPSCLRRWNESSQVWMYADGQ